MAEMSEEAKAQRRAYKRAWAAKNPDKVKAHQRAYWERLAQRQKAQEGAAPAMQEEKPGEGKK